MPATKPRPFRFGTGAFGHIRSRTQFINLARKIEDMGYAIYLIPDHFADALSRKARVGSLPHVLTRG